MTDIRLKTKPGCLFYVLGYRTEHVFSVFLCSLWPSAFVRVCNFFYRVWACLRAMTLLPVYLPVMLCRNGLYRQIF